MFFVKEKLDGIEKRGKNRNQLKPFHAEIIIIYISVFGLLIFVLYFVSKWVGRRTPGQMEEGRDCGEAGTKAC